jgi:hypothetical protein
VLLSDCFNQARQGHAQGATHGVERIDPTSSAVSRRVATRYEKLVESFAAFVLLATIRIWIRFVHTAQPFAHIFTARNPTNIALGELR